MSSDHSSIVNRRSLGPIPCLLRMQANDTGRASTVWRYSVKGLGAGTLVYQEPDAAMALTVWRTRDARYMVLRGSSDSTSYIKVLDTSNVAGAHADILRFTVISKLQARCDPHVWHPSENAAGHRVEFRPSTARPAEQPQVEMWLLPNLAHLSLGSWQTSDSRACMHDNIYGRTLMRIAAYTLAVRPVVTQPPLDACAC